jgi:hypothetical protein
MNLQSLALIDWQQVFNIFNIFFAFINIIIAILLFREQKKLTENGTKPELSIFLDKNPTVIGVYDIVVKNIGKGSAYNLTFSFDPNSELLKLQIYRPLSEYGFFKGIEYFAPNQEYRTWFSGHEMFQQPLCAPLLITVNYNDKESSLKRKKKTKYKNVFIIDPANFWGTVYNKTKTISDLCEELKNIQQEISQVSNNLISKNTN